MANQSDKFYPIKCGIASFAANYAVGIFHPLELIKTRFQSHDGKSSNNLVPKYDGLIKGLRQIYLQQGFYGLFKGVHLATFTAAIANSLFFLIYQKRKEDYRGLKFEYMSATAYASLQSSIITTIITQPFWVIKTRMLLNTSPSIGQYSNLKNKTSEIWNQHGFKGFYLGLKMNLLLSLTGAIQMCTYEGSKIIYLSLFKSSSFEEQNFICGSISKLLSSIITFPLTTIRTRAQQKQFTEVGVRKYQGQFDILMKIVRDEGLRGYFKGMLANILRGIPHRGVYFYFYQVFKKKLTNKSRSQYND